jgi:hypothetical protein
MLQKECQADGCTSLLDVARSRARLCTLHQKADSVIVRGVGSRYCNQCVRAHPVSQFDGLKRSCRARGERKKKR